jgi:hypothetical protein
MRNRNWRRLLAITLACAVVGTPLAGEAGQGRSRSRSQDNAANVSRNQTETGRGRGTTSRLYQDPASSKGYESGYDLGLVDGREGQRYDPVRHRDYRDADRGYSSSYGSKDAYKSNFRTGFRQGYEDGYREGTRTKK